jgi:hypothetical protein
MDDAKECDQNMADADAFIKSVESTEQELVAEHARATQFLTELYAAVQAEKQRRAEEQAKKAAESKAAAAATGTPVVAVSSGSPVAKSASDVWKKNDKPQPAQKALAPSAVSKVKNAAGYVVSQANLLVEQLTSSKQDQMSRLKGVLDEKKKGTREAFEKRAVGEGIIAELKKSVAPIITSMDVVQNAAPMAPAELKGHAGTVKGEAHKVDELAIHAHDALNQEFKSTYDAVAHSA